VGDLRRRSGALRRSEVRELDRRAIEEFGVPSLLLMENAGRACADVAEAMLERTVPRAVSGGPAVVVCGVGNNGGDGLVIARTLVNRGRRAEVLVAADAERLARASEDVATNVRLWRSLGREVRFVASAQELAAELAGAALVVDALFGTGLSTPLREDAAGLVRALVAAQRPTLAVDLPSGLDADDGRVLGAAVRADETVTFVAPKPGLVLGDGPRLAGTVHVAEIGIPRPLLDEAFSRARERDASH